MPSCVRGSYVICTFALNYRVSRVTVYTIQVHGPFSHGQAVLRPGRSTERPRTSSAAHRSGLILRLGFESVLYYSCIEKHQGMLFESPRSLNSKLRRLQPLQTGSTTVDGQNPA